MEIRDCMPSESSGLRRYLGFEGKKSRILEAYGNGGEVNSLNWLAGVFHTDEGTEVIAGESEVGAGCVGSVTSPKN